MFLPVIGQLALLVAPVHRCRREEGIKYSLDEFGAVVGIVVGQEGVVVRLADEGCCSCDDRCGVERHREAVDIGVGFHAAFRRAHEGSSADTVTLCGIYNPSGVACLDD